MGDYAIATVAASCCAPNAIGVKDPFGRLAGPFDLFLPTPFPAASLSPSFSPSLYHSVCLAKLPTLRRQLRCFPLINQQCIWATFAHKSDAFTNRFFWLLSSASSSLLLLLLLLLLWLVLG